MKTGLHSRVGQGPGRWPNSRAALAQLGQGRSRAAGQAAGQYGSSKRHWPMRTHTHQSRTAAHLLEAALVGGDEEGAVGQALRHPVVPARRLKVPGARGGRGEVRVGGA